MHGPLFARTPAQPSTAEHSRGLPNTCTHKHMRYSLRKFNRNYKQQDKLLLVAIFLQQQLSAMGETLRQPVSWLSIVAAPVAVVLNVAGHVIIAVAALTFL